ncbi:MAG TPA: tetratricopeptide repeat protein [Allosphingosinicella sp.]|jgi:tetratricopeptide (TPR) repeat protein
MAGAAAAIFLWGATGAQASTDDRALLSAWAKARAADTAGAAGEAAQSYAAALALSPDNEVLAVRALSQAMSAGDRQLAVRAARILERKGQLAPDASLLLLGEALQAKDWKTAGTYVDHVQKDQIFAFMAPVLRAWVAFGSGKGDPLALLGVAASDQLAAGYAAEHRPLLLLADGKTEQGIRELTPVLESAGARAPRLRLAAAATIRKRDRKAALALLQGRGEVFEAARKQIEDRKRLPGAVDSAAAGVAHFLVRLSLDLNTQEVADVALTYARLATFLAPDNAEGWQVASSLLAAQERWDEAIALLDRIPPQDPVYPLLADRRIRLLSGSGKGEAALALAKAAAEAPSADAADWSRLGEVYSDLKRHEEAAAAYDRALELAKGGKPGQPEWTLWLMKGAALQQADKWPEAKAAFETANKLQPNQPLVLNFLGYGQLERRENVEEAMRLVAEASRLEPDSAEITDSLGWAHYLRGNLGSAIPLLEKAAAARPADAEINEHLGDAYYSAGRRYEARYAWKAALLNAEGKSAERLKAKIGTGLTPQLASP